MKTLLLSWIGILMLFHCALAYVDIGVDNGGSLGEWGELETCPQETVAIGFDLLVEPDQGKGDDTALNAIRLYCGHPGEKNTQIPITSKTGPWGKWSAIQWCPSGFLVRFSLKVEKYQGKGDDTAANNIMFLCSDLTVLEGYGGSWGEYGGWSDICHNGIQGIKTRVKPYQGIEDDTALNNVVFRCL